MCPIAAESKNPKSVSKKKFNKNNEINIEQVQQEESSDDFNISDEDAKALTNVKLGPKGIYTEDSIRVYLQEIGRIRLLRPDEEIELARKIADLLQLEELATQYESERGHFPSVREWAE